MSELNVAAEARSPDERGLWQLSTGQQEALKLLAVLTMVTDHIGVGFLEGGAYTFARAVGRLAFPLFAFLLAYNLARRGVQPRHYYGPLVLLLVVSQGPYALFSEWGAAGRLNIFAELFGGALLFDGLFNRTSPVERVVFAAGGLVVASFGAYGLVGALLVAAWVAALRTPSPWALTLLAVLLLLLNWGSASALVPLLLFMVLRVLSSKPVRLRRLPRWFWYGFYPGHLALIVAIKGLASQVVQRF